MTSRPFSTDPSIAPDQSAHLSNGVQSIKGQGKGGEVGSGRISDCVGGEHGGEVREGVEHLGYEEGESGGANRIHPFDYCRRHELRSEAVSLPAP